MDLTIAEYKTLITVLNQQRYALIDQVADLQFQLAKAQIPNKEPATNDNVGGRQS